MIATIESSEMGEWLPVMAAAYLGQGLTAQEEDKLISLIEAALGV